MTPLDWINSAFVLCAVAMAWLDAWRVYSGEVRLSGIGWPTAFLLTIWPAWDLVFYSYLNQWVSFFVCTLLFSGRLLWLLLLWQGRK